MLYTNYYNGLLMYVTIEKITIKRDMPNKNLLSNFLAMRMCIHSTLIVSQR